MTAQCTEHLREALKELRKGKPLDQLSSVETKEDSVED